MLLLCSHKAASYEAASFLFAQAASIQSNRQFAFQGNHDGARESLKENIRIDGDSAVTLSASLFPQRGAAPKVSGEAKTERGCVVSISRSILEEK